MLNIGEKYIFLFLVNWRFVYYGSLNDHKSTCITGRKKTHNSSGVNQSIRYKWHTAKYVESFLNWYHSSLLKTRKRPV